MKNTLTKTLLTLLFLALLSACAVEPSEPGIVTDPQATQPVEAQAGYQASAIMNRELVFTVNAAETFDGNGKAAFLRALGEGKQQFTVNDISYHFEPMGRHSYRIFRLTPIAESLLGNIEPNDGVLLSNELITAIETAMAEDVLTFEHNNTTFVLSEYMKAVKISTISDAAIANQYYLEAYDTIYNEIIQSYDFLLNLELALEKDERSFSYKDQNYGVLPVAGGYTISDAQSNLFAELSNIYVIPRGTNTDIPLGFKNLVRDAIENEKSDFSYSDSSGMEREYQVEKLENSWSINPK